MKALEPPDSHFLSAAQGWMELGCHREANEELARIRPERARHPDVLQVRWHIQAKAKQWETCLEIGKTMVQVEPNEPYGWINRANALFYLKRYQEAHDALWPALERFPENPFVPYNLACYTCQLGRVEEALVWFQKALDFSDRKQLIEMGLKDPDLEPIWVQIRTSVV